MTRRRIRLKPSMGVVEILKNMEIKIYRLGECFKARGLCVVIDVLRAFTTAAYAFAAGAKEIILVSSIEEAFDLYRADNSLILMGEDGGMAIGGFHFSNSPAEIKNAVLTDRTIVQRTSAGTQGVVACSHASQMMIASFVVAEATIKHIMATSPSHLSLIVTGENSGDEDLALAEYLKEKLLQKTPVVSSFLDRVRSSPAGRVFADPNLSEFPSEDLELALKIDCFSFFMEVKRKNGKLTAQKVTDIQFRTERSS